MRAHERSDANAKGLALAALAAIVAAALMHLGVGWYFGSTREHRVVARHPLPPEPRLQTDPQGDLKAYLRAQRLLLSSYAWVDAKAGVARIPIDRAIELLSRRSAGRKPQGEASSPTLEGVRYEQRLGAELPTALSDFARGKPVIVVFSYYRCPNLCTLVLNGLVRALERLPDRLGQDYRVLSVSIDPRESPRLALAKKRTYLAKLGLTLDSPAADAWRFAVASELDVAALARAAGFHYRYDPVSREYAHPSGIVVITPRAKVSQYLLGIDFEPGALHEALARAAREREGSWVDDVLLYCFHYDPKLSRNGPLILNGIRLAGAVGLLGLLFLLGSLARGGTKT